MCSTPFGRLAVLICYEAIFPAEVREFVLAGADVLANITNDAWFRRTAAPVQHLTMAAFRAVEHRPCQHGDLRDRHAGGPHRAGLSLHDFDFDKYDIRPDDVRILDDDARWMKANPDHLILIEGHADERGTNEYNLALGERRAKAAMNCLVVQGVQAGRFTFLSYGEERPLCREKTEACCSGMSSR